MRSFSIVRLAILLAMPLNFVSASEAKTDDYAEAAKAVRKCGMSPENMLLKMAGSGEIVFGRKSAGSPSPSYEQLACFMEWANKKKARISIMGWES